MLALAAGVGMLALAAGVGMLALAARVGMKAVHAMLRHSSITITADTYTSVLPQRATETAEKTAAIVSLRIRTTPVAEVVPLTA